MYICKHNNRNIFSENQYEEKIDKNLTQSGVLISSIKRDESLTSIAKRPRYYNIPNYVKSLFVGNVGYVVPFESTSIYSMSFALTIILENKEKLYVNVRNYHTIDKIISLISKKKGFIHKEISLYFEGIRLENQSTISGYGIKAKSKISMKILKKMRINGIYSNETYPISIYTSEMIIDIKELFSIETEIDPDMMILIYNDIILEDDKYVFFYDIKKEDEIIIKAIPNENPNELSLEVCF